MNITVLEPWSDPMIHRAFPGGIEDLREYVMELQGLKNHWMKNMNDPDDTRWEYTYHWRLHDYGSWKEKHKGEQRVAGPFRIDQIEAVVAKLTAEPHTRQAQMITWMPSVDLSCYDPPCLQSLYYRLTEEDGVRWLSCNVRFRYSRLSTVNLTMPNSGDFQSEKSSAEPGTASQTYFLTSASSTRSAPCSSVK